MDDDTKIKMEAAAFRGLVEHLQKRTDVQNIDLMNISGFCRNCLAKWYVSAGENLGVDIGYDQAREAIYGMPYDEWKDKYQVKATDEQMRLYKETAGLHADTNLKEK